MHDVNFAAQQQVFFNRTGPIKIMNKGQSYINQNIDDHIIENDGINTSLDHGLGGTLTGAKRQQRRSNLNNNTINFQNIN